MIHHYPSDMAQNFWTAILAFTINFIVTVVISLLTKPKPEPELVGLVYSLTPKPVEHNMAWYAPQNHCRRTDRATGDSKPDLPLSLKENRIL